MKHISTFSQHINESNLSEDKDIVPITANEFRALASHRPADLPVPSQDEEERIRTLYDDLNRSRGSGQFKTRVNDNPYRIDLCLSKTDSFPLITIEKMKPNLWAVNIIDAPGRCFVSSSLDGTIAEIFSLYGTRVEWAKIK